MKRVEAIVRLERLDAVKSALASVGHRGITVCEVEGHGTQRGIHQTWEGEEYVADLLPKVSVVAVVHDHETNDVVDAVVKAARTERFGDGKVFVSTIEDVIRVRTGESGAEAL